MMRRSLALRFLGVDNSHAVELGSSVAVLERGDEPILLVDCGPNTVAAYIAAYRGTLPRAIFITHAHLDHIGGLESLFYRVYFVQGSEGRIKLYVLVKLVEVLHKRLADSPAVLAESGANPIAMRQAGPGNVERSVAAVLAAALVEDELFKFWVRVYLYAEPLVQNLPLHLCSAATFLTAYVLVRRSYSVYEIVYFWGLGGTLQAILTPDLQHGFPSLAYVTFFLAHGLVILGVIYATDGPSPGPRT